MKTEHLKEYQDRLDYIRQYQKSNVRQFKLKFTRTQEADMIAFLESKENAQGFIKSLIRQAMNATTDLTTDREGPENT